jgi:hypothetical protein
MRPLFWTVLALAAVVAAAVLQNVFVPSLFEDPAAMPAPTMLLLGVIVILLVSVIDFFLTRGGSSTELDELQAGKSDLEKQLTAKNSELASLQAEVERLKQKAKIPPSDTRIDATVLQLLGELQEKGRLLDFAMEDIASQPDDRVGAVARIVHQGVREVLTEHFSISPLCATGEGESIELDGNYDAAEIKIVGAVHKKDRISGSVVHRGWQTKSVSLPRINEQVFNTRVIQPTIVEVK